MSSNDEHQPATTEEEERALTVDALSSPQPDPPPQPTPSEPSPDAIASLITQVSSHYPSSARPGQSNKAGMKKKKKKKKQQQQPLDDALDQQNTHDPSPSPDQLNTQTEPTASRDGTHNTTTTIGEQTLVDTSTETNQQQQSTQTVTSSTTILSDEPHNKTSSSPPTNPSPDQKLKPIPQPVLQSPPPCSASLPAAPSPSPPKLPLTNSSSAKLGNKSENKKSRHQTPTRKRLMRLFLPCFASTSHDEDPRFFANPPTSSLSPSQPNQSTPQTIQVSPSDDRRRSNKVTSPIRTKPKQRPSERSSSPLNPSLPNKKSTTSTGIRINPVTRTPRRAVSNSTPPTPVSDTVTPAGAAAATSAANAGGGGVQLPMDETEGVLSAAVVPPGKDPMTLRKSASGTRLKAHSSSNNIRQTHKAELDHESTVDAEEEVDEEEIEDSEDDEEDRIVAMGGMGIPIGEDGLPRPLLAPLDPAHKGRKCLVLDLDETLVHSSFKMIPQSDFVVPVEIENAVHNVYVIKRPGVDQFMQKMGEIYEVVVFTASLSKYADPVLDMLDIHRVVKHRLFRESCYNHKGNYVKDLSQLGRPIGETIIIDNSPASYIFHPNNAVPVSSWFNDPHDTELTDLAAFLTDIAHVPDVRGILDPKL